MSTDTPTDKEAALAAALAAFQGEMPHVGKSSTANAGTYSYSYADLSDIVQALKPAMAKHGLSFSAKPTLNQDGKFVLDYVLRHEAGGRDGGQYPLPTSGTPQQIGSAISYARRYCFTAVTNVAPDEDEDDGRAAADVSTEYTRPARPATPTPAELVTQARGRLGAVAEENRWDLNRVAAVFQSEHGMSIGAATDAAVIDRFRVHLFSLPVADLKTPAAASNGAAQ